MKHAPIGTTMDMPLTMRDALAREQFEGDFEDSLGAREVASTDNSIYQVLPQAIVYPRSAKDINRIVRAVRQLPKGSASLTARGGNTGTNGQSLNRGIIIDFARHMNRIIDIDIERRTVTVQPGVVLDQLNAALASHGLFFPPHVSTASRATIGGMVATDASGKGSRRYGKTSDYIAAMDVVLADGSDLHVEAISLDEAARRAAQAGISGDIHRAVLRIVTDHAEEIAATFPRMNRGLTGYNLQQAYDAVADRFSLAYLLAGSEGTLALTRSVTLRIVPKPTKRILAVLRYADLAGALDHVAVVNHADPLATEIIDDKVVNVARQDILWSRIDAALGAAAHRDGRTVRAISFVEFAGFDDADIYAGRDRLIDFLKHPPSALIDMTMIEDPAMIARLWTLREKAVGLLARRSAGGQGTPFIEDTAVPPDQLPAYVASLRALLDRHGLDYAMFGHADVGCLHVRPLMDMKEPAQAALIRPISDEVAALTKAHGGLLWGEHGRGYRGEYSPFFFGKTLYAGLCRIKRAFDPDDIFNPGKLASPTEAPLDRIDAVPFRGTRDRTIPAELRADYDRALACNGNGACFTWDARDAMCPSYKVTRDRAQSPKGRAALLRAWMTAAASDDPGDAPRRAEVEAALEASLATCLSCKACTTGCPVAVDIPTMKSRFMARRHALGARPLRHRLLRHMEALLAFGRAMPRLANMITAASPVRAVMARLFGFVDMPRFVTRRRAALPPLARSERLNGLSEHDRRRTLVLVEDSFTASFDVGVLTATTQLLRSLGYRVYRTAPAANGKALYLLGWRNAFTRIAARRVATLAGIARSGVRLVGLDAATALMVDQEYREVVGDVPFTLLGLEAVLADDMADGIIKRVATHDPSRSYRLLGHCTETALRPDTLARWAAVFAHVGLTATPVRTGCCGMAGLFGHQRETIDMSRTLFDLSWRDELAAEGDAVLATGYSCRAQAHRLAGRRPPHPVEALAQQLAVEHA